MIVHSCCKYVTQLDDWKYSTVTLLNSSPKWLNVTINADTVLLNPWKINFCHDLQFYKSNVAEFKNT